MLWKIGERIYNLEQAFNVREGVKKENMVPPQRWLTEPQPDGRDKGRICTMNLHNEMMETYLKLRGWNTRTAAPARAKLEELDLKCVADELEAGEPYADWKGPPLKLGRS
jgi:aldehyde:ferredoxin oxidoreductase